MTKELLRETMFLSARYTSMEIIIEKSGRRFNSCRCHPRAAAHIEQRRFFVYSGDNMKTRILAAIALLVCAAASATTFIDRLTADEWAALERGEVLIRSIGKIRNVCVADCDGTQELLTAMRALSPVYTAEIIQLRPYMGNEQLPALLRELLLDIPAYAGLPYFSERAQQWFELYSSAKITAREEHGDGRTRLLAELEMPPLGTIKAEITLHEQADYLYYELTNLNRLRYRGRISVIKPGKLRSAVVVFKDGDDWVVYAVSGVDTYRLPFIEKRVETAFVSRIKAFCGFVLSRL